MRGLGTVAGYALRESLRRRVLTVVCLLTAVFLGLYAWGTSAVFDEVAPPAGGLIALDVQVLTGATLLGMAMFVTLFLGVVLAVFLTLGAVRGDAERGLLQPLVVRPVGRRTLLCGRFAASAGVCALYVVAVYTGAVLITGLVGGFWPGSVVLPAIGLAGAVTIVVALALLGTTVLGTTANGIAVFMLFGAGLTVGLLGQIGGALSSPTLTDVSQVAVWALPFEALYQDALYALTADIGGVTGVVVQLGPLGGAVNASAPLWVWAGLYALGAALLAVRAFDRADL
ncbi:MAG TPA: ABC transporter permease [Solirubrobacteraceae bacterium]|nr:ABC transporter permease [Solirubrobacteraceae bacterium]